MSEKYVGRCAGGPWHKETLSSEYPEVRVPVIFGHIGRSTLRDYHVYTWDTLLKRWE